MKRGSKRRGFTLIEMLVTISIMVAVAGITIPLYVSGRAGTRRSGAVNAVKSALAGARQAAVERRTAVAVEFVASSQGDYMVIIDKTEDPTGTLFPTMIKRQIRERIALGEFIQFNEGELPYWTVSDGWDGDPDDLDDWSGDSDPLNHFDDIVYLADGTCGDAEGETDIWLLDTSEGLTTVLRVLPATGLVVEAWHVQTPDTSSPDLGEDAVTNPRDRGWL